jgi:para-nitrobenzyl esterase
MPDFEGTVVGSEDCLSLNVWAPVHSSSAALPVMVFIHGGYFVQGGSSLRIHGVRPYDGERLAREGAVVVTLNYRLGALGFMAHPALSAESPYHGSGDYGFLDQIAALAWVRDNIHLFDGDPARVMIFGHSAGAYAVAALVASPLAEGLFSRALMESGAPVTRSLAEAEAIGARLDARVGCADLACLRARGAAEIVAAAPESYGPDGMRYGPNVDRHVVPEPTLETIRAGRHNHLPVIVGTTADEAGSMLGSLLDRPVENADDHRRALERLFGPLGARLASAYPAAQYRRPAEATVAAISAVIFTCPSRALASALAASQQEPVRRYLYRHVFRHGRLAALGAAHGFEVPLVFRTHAPAMGFELDAEEERMADAISAYWVRFAASGDPNPNPNPDPDPAAAALWPLLPRYLELDIPIAARDPSADECRAVEDLVRRR